MVNYPNNSLELFTNVYDHDGLFLRTNDEGAQIELAKILNIVKDLSGCNPPISNSPTT